MPLPDIRKDKNPTGELIVHIVLQLLSYVAETERSFIRQRQAEGIQAAKERGRTIWMKIHGIAAGIRRIENQIIKEKNLC